MMYSSIDGQIDTIRKEIKKLERKLDKKCSERDQMFEDDNKDNYSSIEWLVNNPNRPGQYQAMKSWMISEFGGEYRGVTTSGYYMKIGQQGFGFNLQTYGEDCTEEYVSNIKKFVEKVLPFLKPVEGGFVPFTYASGQFSGLFNIKYKVEDGTWWTSNMRYSRDYDCVQMKDLDAAIEFAISKAAEIDD